MDIFFLLIHIHTHGSKWRILKNTCLLFKCVWKMVESSGKIRELCREQNVETMGRNSTAPWRTGQEGTPLLCQSKGIVVGRPCSVDARSCFILSKYGRQIHLSQFIQVVLVTRKGFIWHQHSSKYVQQRKIYEYKKVFLRETARGVPTAA